MIQGKTGEYLSSCFSQETRVIVVTVAAISAVGSLLRGFRRHRRRGRHNSGWHVGISRAMCQPTAGFFSCERLGRIGARHEVSRSDREEQHFNHSTSTTNQNSKNEIIRDKISKTIQNN